MIEEYSVMKNHTLDLVTLPKRINLVQCKWVYQTKFVANGSIDKYNTHIVPKCFSQV